jgi:hypothetical protein
MLFLQQDQNEKQQILGIQEKTLIELVKKYKTEQYYENNIDNPY